MSYQEYKAAYKRDGHLVIRQFLTQDEFQELSDNIGRYIRDVVPGLPPSKAFYQDPEKPETLKQLQDMEEDPFFRDFLDHPKLVSLAETLVGEPVRGNTEWFNKPPNTQHPTPPHQDNFYFCLIPCNVVTLWLPLETVDEENGCLRYVTGSHLEGYRPHNPTEVIGFSQGITDYGPRDRLQEHRVVLQPGDLAAHHGMMIHSAEPNRSTHRNRPAFAVVFKGVSCRRDEDAARRYRENLRRQHQEAGMA